MQDVFVTLDIDWAPDVAIDEAAEVLEGAGCRATWFATHRSEALERLRDSDAFELGIHPNFLPGSSHGSEPEDVLRSVLAVAPEARCVRAHSAAQSGTILKALLHHPQIELDCSVMLPGMPHAIAVPYEDGENMLWRVPNFWSDDYEATMRNPDWQLDNRLSVPGVKVLVFHPIHVALNTSGISAYDELKRQSTDLSRLSRETLTRSRGDGSGAATAFKEVAERLGRLGGGSLMSALIPEMASRSRP